jgi:hypothetical protein
MAIIFSASPPGPTQHHHLIHTCYVGNKFKKELIHLALKEFVENRRRLNLLDLEGKIEFAEDYDYKKLRERQ